MLSIELQYTGADVDFDKAGQKRKMKKESGERWMNIEPSYIYLALDNRRRQR